MKKELLQKLIEDNTVDGVVDYEAVFKVVDKSINDMAKLDKVKSDEIKTNAMKEATTKIMQALQIEDKDNTGDLDDISKKLQDKISKFETDLNDLNTKYDVSTKKNADLELTNKVTKYSEKNQPFAKLKYQEYKTEENTDADVYAKIDEEYPEWDKDYKPSKGNELPDNAEKKQSLVDQMAAGLGVVTKK